MHACPVPITITYSVAAVGARLTAYHLSIAIGLAERPLGIAVVIGYVEPISHVLTLAVQVGCKEATVVAAHRDLLELVA